MCLPSAYPTQELISQFCCYRNALCGFPTSLQLWKVPLLPCAETLAHHFLPFSVESETSTTGMTCAMSSYSSSGILWIHLFCTIDITLPVWRGGTVPPAEVCLSPIPLVHQPAEMQDAAKLSLKNIFNPSSLPLVFPARSPGTC